MITLAIFGGLAIHTWSRISKRFARPANIDANTRRRMDELANYVQSSGHLKRTMRIARKAGFTVWSAPPPGDEGYLRPTRLMSALGVASPAELDQLPPADTEAYFERLFGQRRERWTIDPPFAVELLLIQAHPGKVTVSLLKANKWNGKMAAEAIRAASKPYEIPFSRGRPLHNEV